MRKWLLVLNPILSRKLNASGSYYAIGRVVRFDNFIFDRGSSPVKMPFPVLRNSAKLLMKALRKREAKVKDNLEKNERAYNIGRSGKKVAFASRAHSRELKNPKCKKKKRLR